MKRTFMVFAGVIMMLQLDAATPEDIEAYAEFKDAAAQLDLLAGAADTAWGREEVTGLIDEWQDAGVREHVIKALADNGLDLAKSENTVVVEWGGGGIPYRALYIAEKVFLVKEQDKKIAVNELALNDDIKKSAAELRNLLIEDQYAGVITGAGVDIKTSIVTAFAKDGGKTAIIYDAAPEKASKDTVAVLKAIALLKENCNIANESGA